jgi:hypothetical protein
MSLDDVCQLDQHIRIITDNPGIMSRLHDRHVPWTKFHLGAVIHTNALTACEKNLYVKPLTTFSANNRPDVLRPLPARLEGLPIECQSTDGNDINATLLEGSAGLVRRVKVLPRDGRDFSDMV